MGCGLAKQNRVVMTSLYKENPSNRSMQLYNCEMNYRKKSKIATISCNSLLNIIDYLNFVELKEVGKVSKVFNYLSKQNEILIKFFKRKEIIIKKTQIDSFTVPRKNTSFSNKSTSFDDLYY